jgi:hypothetical protein
MTVGGDGFFARHDQGDPNIVYGSSQDGNPQRYDRSTGRGASIRPSFATAQAIYEAAPPAAAAAPAPGPGGGAAGGAGRWWRSRGRRRTRWGGGGGDRPNWDAPYITSDHSPTRLYWGSQYLYRSDNRGDTVGAYQPGSHAESELRGNPDHGQGVAAGFHRVP